MAALTWGEFCARCEACTACDLAASRDQVVVWRGAVQAPLLFIGEGPGADEDRQGKPFVGLSGQLLDRLLTAHGFTPQDYHICNLVKCRPPGNRAPTAEEVAACKPLLRQQFLFVQPKVICLLGASAYQYFTGDSQGISKVRGRWIESNGYAIMPTYHPSFILREPGQRDLLWQDMAQVRRKLEELGELPPLSFLPD